MQINVLMLTSDVFCPHAGICLLSLFENNKSIETINVRIHHTGLSASNIERINGLAEKYGRNIEFVCKGTFEDFKANRAPFSLPFFLHELPDSWDSVICMDSDTIVTSSLKELCYMPPKGFVMAGVLGTISKKIRDFYEMKENFDVFNAAVLVFNLKEWKNKNILKKMGECEKLLMEKGKNPYVFTETLFSLAVGENLQYRLPLKYNLEPLVFEYSYQDPILLNSILKAFNTYYYTSSDVAEAIKTPSIIHFAQSRLGRPWEEGCIHPQKNIYLHYKELSPWRDIPLEKRKYSFYIKLYRGFRWLAQKLPSSFVAVTWYPMLFQAKKRIRDRFVFNKSMKK